MTESLTPAYILTSINNRSPGYGNEITVMVQADTDQAVDQGVSEYMRQYPAEGFMTRVSARYECPEGRRAVIRRLASCD
jgi:hypothetical protein